MNADVIKPKQVKLIRHKAFARRMEQACETNRNAPPLHHGRLGWVAGEMQRKFGKRVTIESVRRWFSGEAYPRIESIHYLAEIFGVDEAWLAIGSAPDLSPKERKIRTAEVSGAVSLLSSVIQMSGGHPAFPDENSGPNVDLHAVIKGAHYMFKVALATESSGKLHFSLPVDLENQIVVGVRMQSDHQFAFYEIEQDVIDTGERKGGYITLDVDPSELKEIKSFAERL
jgi:transcriptional regulator with XRE-family HTH domain